MMRTACVVALAIVLGHEPTHAEHASAKPAHVPTETLVIAHRGASGLLPEHTLAAYAVAYVQGADVIEPDLVMTKDGVLICSHESYLERTTDIAEVYPDRVSANGHWHAWNFTHAELDRVRRVGPDGARTPGHRIPTLAEMAELIIHLNERTGRDLPIIPELKKPRDHLERGLDIADAFTSEIERIGSDRLGVIVQCFDFATLRKLRDAGVTLPLVYLVGKEPLSPGELADAALVVDGLGPSRRAFDELGAAYAERIREAGLRIYPYTFKDEPEDTRRFALEYRVDGVFTDYPDVARAVIDAGQASDTSEARNGGRLERAAP